MVMDVYKIHLRGKYYLTSDYLFYSDLNKAIDKVYEIHKNFLINYNSDEILQPIWNKDKTKLQFYIKKEYGKFCYETIIKLQINT